MKCTEHQIQSSFFQWIRIARKDLEPYIFAIPNGGLRSKWAGAKLKREGLKPGVFDIFIAIPNARWHGLWLEFKAGKNKLTDNQIIFMNNMVKNNYECAVCYSFEAAKAFLEIYLGERNA